MVLQEGPPEDLDFPPKNTNTFSKLSNHFETTSHRVFFLQAIFSFSFTLCRTREVFMCPAEEFFEFFLNFVVIFGSFKTHEQSLRSYHCVALQLLFFDKFAQEEA